MKCQPFTSYLLAVSTTLEFKAFKAVTSSHLIKRAARYPFLIKPVMLYKKTLKKNRLQTSAQLSTRFKTDNIVH